MTSMCRKAATCSPSICRSTRTVSSTTQSREHRFRAPSSSLVDPRNGQPVPDTCFDDPNQQDQVTIGNGYYKFDINFSSPSCPGPGNYLVQVTAPSTAFVPGISQFIPPTSDLSTLPFDVPACPGSGNDAALGTPNHCEATRFELAPPATVPARSVGTEYHLFLTLDDTQVPGSSQLFNNHIPLDPSARRRHRRDQDNAGRQRDARPDDALRHYGEQLVWWQPSRREYR